MGSKSSKHRVATGAITPRNPPEDVIVIPEGSSLSDALFILMARPKGHALMVWLATHIIVSRDIKDRASDIKEVMDRDVDLAVIIRAFLDLVVQMTEDQDDDYRFSEIMSALHRRMAVWNYRSLDPSKNEIRLLRIHPKEKPSSTTGDREVVACTMEVRSLDDPSLEFDALSYVWGDAMQVMPVFVNNKVLLVTKNLYEALESFRDNGKTPGLLWADAICINQQDGLERNHQVAAMARLYRKAKTVHVWMGQETKYTAVLFDKLVDCGGDVLRPGWSIMKAIHLADVESGSIHGLLDLLARPWWTRLWTLQEAELADNPRVHVGSQEFEFRRLGEVLVTLATMMASELDNGSRALRAVSQSALGDIQQLMFFLDAFRTTGNINLTRLMDSTCHCQSTLPHDRIYALLGMIPTDLGIKPRYDHSIEVVFEDAAFKMMKSERNLDMLRITGLTENRKLKLPSWVPEFGNSIPGLTFYTIGPGFKAGLEATCFIDQDRSNELRVRGLVFDQIRDFTKPLNHDISDPASFGDIRKSLRSCHEFTQSVSVEDASDDLSFWQTLTTDRLLSAGASSSRWVEDKRATRMEAEWTDFILDDQYVLKDDSKRLLKSSVWSTHSHSKLFVTTGGRIGLADIAPIEKGDVVAILAGSNDPAILRPVPEQGDRAFQFVQNCYCHNTMDGEVVVEAFVKNNGFENALSGKLREAVESNKNVNTRYKFRDAQPKDFQIQVQKAIDPLFEELVLV